MKEDKLAKSVIFFASPFLSLPIILRGIYKRSWFSLKLLALLFGLMSYLYIPAITNDRARYFERYINFKTYNFNDFLNYLGEGRPDFIMHFLFYASAKLFIPVQLLFMSITCFTVAVWLWIFRRIMEDKSIKNSSYFICFLTILLCISLPDLLSGTRFYFGAAFLMLGFYKSIWANENKNAVLLIIIASFTHFSVLIFLPLYFLLKTFPRRDRSYRIFFLVSLIFLITPKALIVPLFESFHFTGGIGKKIELYLSNEDLLSQGINEGAAGNLIVYILSSAWSYFAYVYLILTIRRKSIYRNSVYLFFGIVNIFNAVPTIYSRYLIILSFLFALLLIKEFIDNKKPIFLIVLLGFFSLKFISSLIIMRYNISESFFNYHTITMFTIFLKKIEPTDFLVF